MLRMNSISYLCRPILGTIAYTGSLVPEMPISMFTARTLRNQAELLDFSTETKTYFDRTAILSVKLHAFANFFACSCCVPSATTFSSLSPAFFEISRCLHTRAPLM